MNMPTRKAPRFFIYGLLFSYALLANAADISNVKVDTTENSATIEWKTDVNTDATINYGIDPRVGVARYPQFDKKTHSIILDKLEPSTTYYFNVTSTDEQGNKSTTAGQVFTTDSSSDSPVVDRIIKDLDKITEPEDIVKVIEKVQQVAGDVIKPPVILGQAKIVTLADSAEITWTTDRESTSMVHLAPESEYDSGRQNPYTISQGDDGSMVTKHRVEVIGLEPTTIYHYKLSSKDSVGLNGETEDDTFKTKSLLPEVENIRITRVQETAATISWSSSGVLAKGIVEYTNLRNKATKSAGNPVFATSQSIQLTGLEFGTRYSFVISAINEGGEVVSSEPRTFVTVRDVVPPAISKVNNESTLFPGEEVKIQTIIAWETDEPAACQVFYTQGLIKNAEGKDESLLPEQNPLTSHTQVIVGFAPATVYKFWMKCLDLGKNESQSEDFVLITPIKEKSIIDIILENFEGTFGWVKNIAK